MKYGKASSHCCLSLILFSHFVLWICSILIRLYLFVYLFFHATTLGTYLQSHLSGQVHQHNYYLLALEIKAWPFHRGAYPVGQLLGFSFQFQKLESFCFCLVLFSLSLCVIISVCPMEMHTWGLGGVSENWVESILVACDGNELVLWGLHFSLTKWRKILAHGVAIKVRCDVLCRVGFLARVSPPWLFFFSFFLPYKTLRMLKNQLLYYCFKK